jgi:hypothetical protein
MRCKTCIIAISICLAGSVPSVLAQQRGAAAAPSLPGPDDPIKVMVDRLDLEKYKATIKGLTQFGDRRQGTERNRRAIDWIEAQLKSYGCTNTERIKYEYNPAPAAAGGGGGGGRGASPFGPSGARIRGYRIPEGVNNDPNKQPDLKLRELNREPSTPGSREESLLHEDRHDSS